VAVASPVSFWTDFLDVASADFLLASAQPTDYNGIVLGGTRDWVPKTPPGSGAQSQLPQFLP